MGVERRVKNSEIYRVWCILKYGSFNFKIEGKGKNLIVRLSTCSLLDLRLSLDCKFYIKIFFMALDVGISIYIVGEPLPK